MKKYLSIKGWNPEVYDRDLVIGDYVAFIDLKSKILRVGVIVESPKGGTSLCVKCLTNEKLYYPYTQDILLFSEKTNVKELISKIIEKE